MHQPRAASLMVSAVLCFVVGGCTVVQSESIRKHALSLPRMTCRELVENGPGGNQFVRLTDVHLCSRGHSFYRDMDAAMVMYVPIHSRHEKEPDPPELTLLLEVHDDRDRTALLRDPDVGEINCQVDQSVSNIDVGFARDLKEKYAGIPFAKLRLVSVGLHEPTEAKAERTWWYGAAAFLVGTVLVIWLAARHVFTAIGNGSK